MYMMNRKRIVELIKTNLEPSFGFNIKGGVDFGCPVHIRRVEEGSLSDRAGLLPGTQILSANGVDFTNLTHNEALKVLKNQSLLTLETMTTTNSIEEDSYTWIDRHGNPVSSQQQTPPTNKRIINIEINPGQNLGLMIRGGVEYGLGIFVTGVDPGSVAERAGLQLGDEVLEVNGKSFTSITHDKAVAILKSSRKMTIVAWYVGRIPSDTHHNLQGNKMMNNDEEKRRMIEEKARTVLTKSEHSRFTFYRLEYQQGFLPVQTFVRILLELLNTVDKYTLLTEVRELIRDEDVVQFDELIYNTREMPPLKKPPSPSSSGILQQQLPPPLPLPRVGEARQLVITHDPLLNQQQQPQQPPQPPQQNCVRYKVRVQKTKPILGIAIEGGSNTPHRLPRIIDVNDEGSACTSNLKPGQVLLTVDGKKLDGLPHEEIARLILDCYVDLSRPQIEFLVVQQKSTFTSVINNIS